ncbi:hypothetical protein B9479_008241 [Cryptococcus floricola]|uniref:Uncharacterized protein n=1 Tax=Cryptococcus floricola TaxID=2591691 RepID=A0A5D3ALV6_9TREE|nr:hypothetical protein B9479_008241 [Cryptococcus floricola]
MFAQQYQPLPLPHHLQLQPPQPPQTQPLPQQPQAPTRWQRWSLLLRNAIICALSLSTACLAVGFCLNVTHPTVAGGALRSYAGPGFWILGALLWLPGAIAIWSRVPGAESTERRWLGLFMAVLAVGIINTVGKIVLSAYRDE